MANHTDSLGYYAAEVLDQTAARQPNKTAIIAKEEELTFAALNQRVHALAGDTDGIDGVESSAGAYASPDSIRRWREAGVDPSARLADNDAWTAFDRLGDLVVTGPTLTNVNDFRAMLIT